MTEIEQAIHELDRLQGIITRHEGFMFTLRGWLLTVVGALLAAYYTANIDLDETVLRAALLLVTLVFFIVESRHANLVEAVVERASLLETQIRTARTSTGAFRDGWYDGPRVSEVCEAGAKRWVPASGMTFILNRAFYVVVLLLILLATLSLPPRTSSLSSARRWSSRLVEEAPRLVPGLRERAGVAV